MSSKRSSSETSLVEEESPLKQPCQMSAQTLLKFLLPKGSGIIKIYQMMIEMDQLVFDLVDEQLLQIWETVADYLKTYVSFHFAASQPTSEDDIVVPCVHSGTDFTNIFKGSEFCTTSFLYPTEKQLIILWRRAKRAYNREKHDVDAPSSVIMENPVLNISTSSTTAARSVGLVDVLSSKDCQSDDVLGDDFGLWNAISGRQSLLQRIS